VLAAVLGTIVGFLCHAHLVRAGISAGDFTWPWRAARVLLSGENPYVAIRPVGPYPFDAFFKYPLPAALVALPLAGLSAEAAGAIFIGSSTALLAFAITREGYERLPIFFSGPFVSAVAMVQWSPLLAAAALLPWLGFMTAAKPNLGLAVLAGRPTAAALLGAAALGGLSLLVAPWWPMAWLQVLRLHTQTGYRAPILLPGGVLVLLALLRWRRPEARLVAVLACCPQIIAFYDQLLVLLVPRTLRESATASLASLIAFQGWIWRGGHSTSAWTGYTQADPWVMALVYAPAVVMILRRPNEGLPPPWLARAISAARARWGSRGGSGAGGRSAW
jgi:hypothetical protein